MLRLHMHVYAARAASWDNLAEGLPAFDVMAPGMGQLGANGS
jgi:hypothetical protein